MSDVTPIRDPHKDAIDINYRRPKSGEILQTARWIDRAAVPELRQPGMVFMVAANEDRVDFGRLRPINVVPNS